MFGATSCCVSLQARLPKFCSKRIILGKINFGCVKYLLLLEDVF